ncbi:reverse transcriptase domain-containing protein [Tanacetum coccineum]
MTSTSFAHPSKQVLVEKLKEKSIDEKEVLVVVEEEGCTWMTPIYKYLIEEILPKEKRKARAIRRKVGRYVVTNEIQYKKSFLGPWLRCVGPLQANYVLKEIHEGSCSMHAGPRSVHHPVPRNLQQELTPITSPWPFQHSWTLPGGSRDNPFKDWCEKLCIRQCFAFVKHPQANGLVERANRSLGEGIKARLDERSKNWLEDGRRYNEIGMPTLRIVEVDMIKNDEALGVNLDLLEERRE